MENHGTVFKSRHKRARENVEAMKEIWTQSKPEYHGEFVNFDPMMAWPKPVQKPHPPVIVGGAFPYSARRAIRYGDGWIPQAARGGYTEIADMFPEFRKMAPKPGAIRLPSRSPSGSRSRTPTDEALRGSRRIAVVFSLEFGEGRILPLIDAWTGLMRQVNG